MNKFRINKVVSKSSNEPNEPVDNNPTDILNNNDEFETLTHDDHLLLIIFAALLVIQKQII